MFLTVHSTAGIIIGQSVVNPLGSFFIGLFSHYLLDIIPHGDEIRWGKADNKKMAQLAIIDHLGVIAMITSLLIFKPDFTLTLGIIFGALGAMTPDWLMAVYRLTVKTDLAVVQYINKIIAPLEKTHNYLHHKIISYELPFVAGMLWQLIFFIFAWLLI